MHASFQLAQSINRHPVKQVRLVSKADCALFRSTLSRVDTCLPLRRLDNRADIDATADDVTKAITDAFNTACPTRTIRENSFRLTAATVALIRLKRRVRRKWQRTGDDQYRQLYNDVRHQVDIAVSRERRENWEAVTGKLNDEGGPGVLADV